MTVYTAYYHTAASGVVIKTFLSNTEAVGWLRSSLFFSVFDNFRYFLAETLEGVSEHGIEETWYTTDATYNFEYAEIGIRVQELDA